MFLLITLEDFCHHTIESEQERRGGCLFQQMVVILPKLQREHVVVEGQILQEQEGELLKEASS